MPPFIHIEQNFCIGGDSVIEDWIIQNIDSNIKYTGNGQEIHICCPVCGEHRYRLYIGLNNGLLYCHNCGFKGSVINLIQYVQGISYTRAMGVFNDVKGSLILPQNVRQSLEYKLLGTYKVIKRAIPLPEECQDLGTSQQILAKKAIKYLQSRAITPAQIHKYKMGFCALGKYAGRVIIPIYEADELKFWVARAISPKAKLKEKSPSNAEYQYGKSEVIFNIDRAAREYHSAVISEGIFDALSWGDIGVSLLGKSLYDEQLRILLEYKSLLREGIYIALDADAIDSALNIAQQLSAFFHVRIICIPDEYDDPNNYLRTHSRSAMWKLIDSAQEYNEFTALRIKLSRIQ